MRADQAYDKLPVPLFDASSKQERRHRVRETIVSRAFMDSLRTIGVPVRDRYVGALVHQSRRCCQTQTACTSGNKIRLALSTHVMDIRKYVGGWMCMYVYHPLFLIAHFQHVHTEKDFVSQLLARDVMDVTRSVKGRIRSVVCDAYNYCISKVYLLRS